MKKYISIITSIVFTTFITLNTSCSYDNDDNQTIRPNIEDPVPDPLPEPLPAEYLAALALPNSFMIKPGESITIPVIKAFAVWRQYEDIVNNRLSREAKLSVSLVWQDQPGLITELNLSKDEKEYSKITVQTANKKGNAVIAFKADGKICWSWHIWATNYDPDKQIGGKTYRWDNNDDGMIDYVWMDRNLGAETNGIQLTKADSLAASGLFYQWGRKDPLPGARVFRYTTDNNPPNFDSRPIYDMNGKQLVETGTESGDGIHTVSTGSDPVTANLIKSITNPMVYLRGTDGAYNDWFASQVVDPDDSLWNWDGNKGIFDPCPEGWRVPAYKNGLSPWNGFTAVATAYSRLGVFPYAGFRYTYIDGSLKNSGFQTAIFCATVNPKANARYLTISKDYLGVILPKIDVTSRSTAMSVRCVKNDN